MLSFLFIGVGGSGGETVRYTMRELDRQLRRSGWNSGLPAGWQFMHVDVRQKPDDVNASIPDALNDRLRHVPLTAAPLRFSQCASLLSENATVRPGLAGWWPDPNIPQTKIYEGAGQRRAIGRITALARMGQFDGPLHDAITALSSGEAREELEKLGQHLTAPPRGIDEVPARVVVVSSLGGGSGSGAFLDIIQYLRATAVGDGLDWLANAIAVLYAPDVFDKSPEKERRGVAGNSLAAMSELLASYLVGAVEPMDPSQAALLSAAGGAASLEGNVGPDATLVIGRSNGKIEFGRAGEVFQAVGKTLATFAFEPKIQGSFDAFVGSNWGELSPEVQIPIMEPGRPNPVSSFGFASVSLGRSLFAEYAAERLANRALFRLQSGHKEGFEHRQVRDDTLIKNRADAYDESVFLPASGVWELGPDRNQVLDAIRGTGMSSRLDELERSFLKNEISANELHADEWLASFTNAFNGIAEKFSGKERLDRLARAKKWVDDIQAQLLGCTVDSLARNGIPVTLELLSRLDGQLEQAKQGLDEEAKKHSARAAGFLQAVVATFASLTGRAKRRLVGDPSASTFTTSTSDRRKALADRLEVDLRDLASRLLEDLRKNFLPGLVAVVEELSSSLGADLNQPEVKKAVGQWSVDAVGTHLQPTPNEYLLEKVDTFPKTLDTLLRAQFDAPIKEAIDEAVGEILRGGWASASLPQGGPQTMIDPKEGRAWVTSVPEVLPQGRAPIAASFSASLTANDVLERARDWVRNANGPVRDHIDQTLASWLAGTSASERTTRGNEFIRNFDSALAAARPLIGYDSRIYSKVHGDGGIGASVSVSPIPVLEPRSATRTKLSALLVKAGFKEAVVDACFGENASDSVEIVAFLGAAVHPIVFSSFATTIKKAWTTRNSTPEGVASFWAFKRARPLTSFVPLSPELQRALVRGWMTARLLNLVAPMGDNGKPPARVWSPTGLLDFPDRLLTPPRDDEELLPSLLESLPTAMVAYATGQAQSLAAYFELIRLGSERHDLPPGCSQSTALETWIQKGQTVTPKSGGKRAPAPLADTAGTAKQTLDERAKALLASVKDTTDLMADLDAFDLTEASLRGVHPLYEIRELIGAAAADLADAISSIAGSPRVTGPQTRPTKAL